MKNRIAKFSIGSLMMTTAFFLTAPTYASLPKQVVIQGYVTGNRSGEFIEVLSSQNQKLWVSVALLGSQSITPRMIRVKVPVSEIGKGVRKK